MYAKNRKAPITFPLLFLSLPVLKRRNMLFLGPSPNLIGTDDGELRRRILGLSQADARRLGIGKSTLHYLWKNAKSTGSLRMYKKVRDKLKPPIVSAAAERVL
jgi:hypothetical protein